MPGFQKIIYVVDVYVVEVFGGVNDANIFRSILYLSLLKQSKHPFLKRMKQLNIFCYNRTYCKHFFICNYDQYHCKYNIYIGELYNEAIKER